MLTTSRSPSGRFVPRGQRNLLTVLVLLALLVAATPAAGQITDAAIRGRVTDETAGALPGVSVTITSPALITPQMLTVTDAEGVYAFNGLPVGVYDVRYELDGFQPLVREEIRLTAGFSATLNVGLLVGGIEETITVTGVSPVVDVTHTAPRTTLSNQMLVEVIPTARNYKEIIQQMPSIMGRKQDLYSGVAASTVGAYGIRAQQTTMIDGVNTRQTAGYTGVSPDFSSLEEFSVNAIGGTAEQALPGLFVNLITKSGGNQFHGRYEFSGTHDNLVGDNSGNLPPGGAGLRREAVDWSYETNADLGGPLIQDRFWFYAGVRWAPLARSPFELSGAPGPDGAFNTPDDVPGQQTSKMHNITGKLTYQLNPQYKLTAFAHFNAYDEDPHGHSSVRRDVPLIASRILHAAPTHTKLEIDGTPTRNTYFSAKVGTMQHNGGYQAQPEALEAIAAGNYVRVNDIRTGVKFGHNLWIAQFQRMQWQPDVALTWLPESGALGSHEIKIGWGYLHRYEGRGQENKPGGNYIVYTDDGAPFEFESYNFPYAPRNYVLESGTYIQDFWRMGDQVTVNLGLRFDTFRTSTGAGTKFPGEFGPQTIQEFESRPTGDWKMWAPRLGLSYDVTGEGTTVVKASWGKYNHTPGDNFSVAYNPNNVVRTVYRWSDQDGNGDYTPGEVDLDVNGPDFLRITGASNNFINPDLQMPHTLQSTLSVEREVARNFAARLTYVHVKENDRFSTINVARPYSAWNIPLTMTNPGQDGMLGTGDDGGSVTLYDYDPAYRGAAFVRNERHNWSRDRSPTYHTIEGVLQRRTTGRWGLLASVSATRYHSWSVGVPSSPNDDINNEYTFWESQFKLTGHYNLPRDFLLAVGAFFYSGHVGQATYRFRGFASASSVNVRLEPRGGSIGPMKSLVNFRLAKSIPYGGNKRMRVSLDVLNLFNAASQWSINRVYGRTYGQIGSIDQPRTIQGRISWDF